MKIFFTRTFAVAVVLVLTATGLWAAGAEEAPAAAADKQYVTDPTTGKVVSAPEYGGTITYALSTDLPGPDTVLTGGAAAHSAGPVVEKLGAADWAAPRDMFSFNIYELSIPANTRGVLAESWSQPDPLTYIIKVRQGVHWHDKAPMNGRELTAEDVEYNFHRMVGIGSGFTEKSPMAYSFRAGEFDSITATDQSTVVFRMNKPRLSALASILDDWSAWIYPPEVIKEHGDVSDWRNLVGTGPMMMTDWTKDSSRTFERNPDYWGYDEKYPENRLPYIDRLRGLVMPEVATRTAALRSGRVDYVGALGITSLRNLDQVDSLQRTNPEILISSYTFRNDGAVGLNVQLEPFDDIRVRKAMQMAINLDEINNSYFGGFGDTTPQGKVSRSYTAAVTQFEDWPEDVKKVFDYDPEGAEALLDEAGYPRGADGIRFKTKFLHLERYDLNYTQLITSYWNKIGIDVVDIEVEPAPAFGARRTAKDHELINHELANYGDPINYVRSYSNRESNPYGADSNVSDPDYEAMLEAAEAATTIEEQHRLVRELNQYGIEKFWMIWTPNGPQFNAIQPWIIGFNNENWMGNGQVLVVFTRLWIDHDLKTEMGY
ncbi:MAG: ABC transporter substrate-binding protein [Spirochaetaceae bacterium]|nr:ABC transporter substrate-binding protein [Spirochaetaceae bacterium]